MSKSSSSPGKVSAALESALKQHDPQYKIYTSRVEKLKSKYQKADLQLVNAFKLIENTLKNYPSPMGDEKVLVSMDRNKTYIVNALQYNFQQELVRINPRIEEFKKKQEQETLSGQK